MTPEPLSGIPIAVDPERIEHEVTELWKAAREPGPADRPAAGRSPFTHARLSNLVLYLPDPGACEEAGQVLDGVARRFPSRIILLTHGEARAGGAALSAWVSAVCRIAAAGAPPVCCEQITLEAAPGAVDLFPGAVLPLLVPDLPVFLCFPCAGGEPLLDLLEAVADRVVFDSRVLGIDALERARRLVGRRARGDADDLAWRDTFAWRRALSDIFDDPAARAMLELVESIAVEFRPSADAAREAPGRGGARAALLGGWLASRLGFRAAPGPGAPLRRTLARDGRALDLALLPAEREGVEAGGIASVRIDAGGGPGAGFLQVLRVADPRVLQVEYHTPETCVIPRRIPHRRESEAELLGTALERPTHQGVLHEALEIACALAGGEAA